MIEGRRMASPFFTSTDSGLRGLIGKFRLEVYNIMLALAYIYL